MSIPRRLRFGSVCSGIEAASAAWLPLGWECSFMSEIEAFPRAVLAHHHPETPLHSNFTTIQAGDYAAIDVLVGGTPCQSFSIAGLRRGLADERGNLALEYLRLADRLRPLWLVWENVPGVLSSNGGRDFGSFLGGLVELGYGFAYRMLDAQYFGLAQRRKRVFVVGYLGDWRRAAAVLFEHESLRGYPAPSRQSRQDVAPTITARPTGAGRLGLDGGLIAAPLLEVKAFGGNNSAGPIDIAPALNASPTASGRLDFESEAFIAHVLHADGFDANEDGSRKGTQIVPISFHGSQDPCISGDITHPIGRNHGLETCNPLPSGVRRLTPRECERLQGFPDDYTLIPWRKNLAPDGPRYKALGNSMAVPVMRWIGERIQRADSFGVRGRA